MPAPWYRRRAPLACVGLVVAGSLALAAPLAAAANTASAPPTAVAASLPAAPAASDWPYDAYGGGTTRYGGSSQSASGQTPATTADTAESTGVVIIETTLGYEDAQAAGTGMVLTPDGLVLTNNHVIEGSTEITVTIAATGQTYTAAVVGTDADDDVALLQLQGASGLQTVTIDDDAETVGDAVTAVGNASGGGVLLAADGAITELDSSVTTSSDRLTAGETLDGMIEFAADVVAGDSGGALLDAEGEVVGMTTAASSGSATTVAYAIPIEDALAIVDKIRAGDETDGVAIGSPAFLGVQVARVPAGYRYGGSGSQGALIAGAIDGTPAADAGLAAGDTITAVDGTAVADADALSTLLAGYEPGDTVTLTWVDRSGAPRSAAVTLIEGPAA
ncbi:trypsin-like peptidase domain-containing protein [Microbacterium jejuense]|uniref:Trypsin-like peptidase domain-containing protein n=1 Tax=Microbacterium jejuense TaxID=1263637 RepID=A0ABS7HTD6_9MICO|nr:trypsin-like peptidase domain-containing protein [Microbacterium jejuense]MBW9095501.1 trypsin-like peptidase domain-containing protein [Microbacterium jejuense]